MVERLQSEFGWWNEMSKNGISRFRSLHISRKDLVVEIGSGSTPYWRSDVLVDKYVSDSAERPGQDALFMDRPFIVGDALNLPFQDSSIDFVISRNLLEHLIAADRFLQELTRIGQRGYLTMPSILSEKIFGWTKHVWFIRVEKDVLRLQAKENSLYDSHLSGIFHKLYARDYAFRRFYQRNRSLFVEEFYWEGHIDYHIEGDLEHLNRVKTTQAKFDFDSLRALLENQNRKKIQNPLPAFARMIASKARLSHSLELLGRFACPVCLGKLALVESGLICSGCSRKYPVVAQIPVLVEEAENWDA
jgi:uncharacterized protein YbaR (Trm112 family)